MIRAVESYDVDDITDIYNHYITHTIITFEEEPITVAEMQTRITTVTGKGFPWLVCENEQGKVIGYAYASSWRERYAYRFSVEVTVYLAKSAKGNGYGYQLYRALFEVLKARKITTVIGGITLPNSASIALHEKLGMKKVAHFEKVGYKFNQWLDVGYWQGQLADIKLGGKL